MTGKPEIKNSLNHAIDQLPQPSFKKISETPVEKMKEMDSYTCQEPVQRKVNLSSIGRRPVYRLAIACICAVFCLTGGWYTRQNLMTDAIIDVDVNPSFEIAINRRERILSLKALNADAALILEKRDYKGWELEAAVESLCTVMEESGYLNSDRRTILISVENKSQKRSDQLKEQLTVCINSSLKTKSVMPRIVTQNRKSEKTVANDARNYDISPGKLQFIRSMVERYPDLEEHALAKLSLEELYAIVRLREEKAPDWFEIEEDEWDDDRDGEDYDGDDRDEEDHDVGEAEDNNKDIGRGDKTYTKSGDHDTDDDDDDDERDDADHTKDRNHDSDDDRVGNTENKMKDRDFEDLDDERGDNTGTKAEKDDSDDDEDEEGADSEDHDSEDRDSDDED